MNYLVYVGRNNNIHDQKFTKTLSKNFKVLEIYTKELESRTIPVVVFEGASLIVAGPLTDAISAIPGSVKVPILGISHAFDLNTEFDAPNLADNIARCTAILSDCRHITRTLRQTYDYREKIYELPWGCDCDYFSNIKISFEKKLKILVTRNWYAMYRNDLILNSLRLLELKNIEYTCTFIGDGPLLDNQVRNSDGLSKSGNIQFLGQQTKTEIRDAMSGHWIYVSAASSDGTSISLLEAMAAGMICITTDFPSNQEWIQHAVNGFLFPNGDFEALASLIEMISYLTMEEKIKIGKAAKEVILKRGDWKRNQIDFISLVNSMSSKEF